MLFQASPLNTGLPLTVEDLALHISVILPSMAMALRQRNGVAEFEVMRTFAQ